MKVDRAKVVKLVVIFLGVMLFFTLISNKVNYMMTPEVVTTAAHPGKIGYTITAYGTHNGGGVKFSMELQKESYVKTDATVIVKFANTKGEFNAKVTDKTFDADSQTVSFTCELDESVKNAGVYDGQNCTVTFFYLIDNYTSVLPKEAVIREGTTFVYVIEAANTVLGERQVVRRREVTVLAEDEFNAAIEGGLSDRDTIVRVSSKPLRNEATVRIVR